MWSRSRIRYVLYVIFAVVHGHELRSFDDTVLFKINWRSKTNPDLLKPRTDVEPYFITSANNEKYQCFIPNTAVQEKDYSETYIGPNPIVILTLIFNQYNCSYRVETYWTYELCHGRSVRQYHEDRDGKKGKTQEYYLGVFDETKKLMLYAEYKERENKPNRKASIPVKKVEGIDMPYVEVEMGDGTMCDLTNKPRSIKVLYICYQHSKNQIYSLKETSSCEYEAIVLSSILCTHPDYQPQNTGENEINCQPVDNAPEKPRSLIAMEMESLKLRYLKATDDQMQEVTTIQDFIKGKNCLYGSNGWWKYEFCYGRWVVQYHIERNGSKTVVSLGKFDKQKHLEWIAAHPQGKPGSSETRNHLSHFYSDGTICDKTGKPRQTEVKMKCVDKFMAGSPSVSMYLLESVTCEYILIVASSLICDILEYADENGLLNDKFEGSFDKLSTTAFQVELVDLDERIANGDD